MPKLAPSRWERGSRSERRKRLDDAIHNLGELMKKFDHYSSSANGNRGDFPEGKKKSRWEFCP